MTEHADARGAYVYGRYIDEPLRRSEISTRRHA
jgi:hypothetical protein